MSLKLVALAVCASLSLCLGIQEHPAMQLMYTDKSLAKWHQEYIMGEKLEEKLKNFNFAPITGNFSTITGSSIHFELMHLTPVSYRSPKVKVNVSSEEGILLNLRIPEMKLRGEYAIEHLSGSYKLGKWNGHFIIEIRNSELKMKRNITLPGDDTLIWESSNITGSIQDFDVDFNDTRLNSLFAMCDSKQVKEFIVLRIAEASKNATKHEMDISLKLTENIDVNMGLVYLPIQHDGDIELHFVAEAFFKGDNKTVLKPRYLVPFHPGNELLYRLTDKLFDSVGEVVHKYQLLSFNFTKADLPQDHKKFLDPTCTDEDCFVKVCSEAGQKFSDFDIEINLSTNEAPFVNITSDSIIVTLEMSHNVTAKKGNEPHTDVINGLISLVLSVSLSVKDGNLRFHTDLVKSNISVLESKCGVLDHEKLSVVIGLALDKGLIPVMSKLNTEGVKLVGLLESLKVSDYETRYDNGVVDLLLNFEETNYVNPDKSSVRDIDIRPHSN